jgi:hypothetical protein
MVPALKNNSERKSPKCPERLIFSEIINKGTESECSGFDMKHVLIRTKKPDAAD